MTRWSSFRSRAASDVLWAKTSRIRASICAKQSQVGCHNRHSPKQRRINKSFRTYRRRGVGRSKVSGLRQHSRFTIADKQLQRTAYLREKSAERNESRWWWFGNAVASDRRERPSGDKTTRIAPLRCRRPWSKECHVDFGEYDFIRNAVVQNEVFFLQSKCASCGFSFLAPSIEEVLEQEQSHRSACTPSSAA